MKIRFYVNATKPSACAAKKPLAQEARRLGLTVTTGTPDVLIALGGDGTILRATREFPDWPVLGLNLGGLGYLSGVSAGDFSRALQMLAAQRFSVQTRTMLMVEKCGAKKCVCARALNEVMVRHEMSGHAVALDVAADGRAVTRYCADGLVLATPTGSTAYSLSAGGPILMPDTNVIVITPLCPHALSSRPIVTRDTVRFSVTARQRARGRAEQVGVYADGEKVFSLLADESAEISRAQETAKLVELDGYDPYEVLSKKLGWCGSRLA